MTWAATTGCPEHGWWRRWACFGLRATGAWAAGCTPGIPAIGGRISAFTAALTMDSVWGRRLCRRRMAQRGFCYNRAVMNVDTVRVTNVYRRTVVVNENHVACNGGEGGIAARPTVEEEPWSREPHSAALSSQGENEHAASQNPALLASENHGRPEVAATARPGELSGHDVVKAHAAGADSHDPAISPREAGLQRRRVRRGPTKAIELADS
jgi:hypothetical protein